MAKYYATIAGLPNIGVDDRKLPIQTDALQAELRQELTKRDRRLLDLLLMEQEIPQILATINAWLSDDSIHWEDDPSEIELEPKEPLETIDAKELADYIIAVQQRTKRPRTKQLPDFIKEYIEMRLPDPELEEELEEERAEMREELQQAEEPYTIWQLRLEQDKLMAMYYDYLIHQKNRFVAEWAEFNLNIKNILAAYTSRQLGFDPKEYIIGGGTLQHHLRTSQAADFSITEELFPQIQQLVNISREEDIARREQLIDRLRWDWLEEQTFFKPFDIEYLLAYYLELEILERWVSLNEETGEQVFRQIVSQLKHESTTSLEEFKRKQKK
ncbi:DUF2764 family protein [uncultured Porphyromonas sp.]|uniref:DUF2764 family protein n=1 Tax=uncultured Porphyromonas sp. TaxID=159274 RepID=UPI002803D9AA|nr:DUF2764 family protein [uncultured Porphyromonas sp.]